MVDFIDSDDYPWELSKEEMSYLSSLNEKERNIDLGELERFVELAEYYDIKIDPMNPRRFQFGEASEFNLKINKIIDKHLGFDNRIKNDSFFRRFPTIKIYEIDSLPLNTTQKFPYIMFSINLWGEFSLDRLSPNVFQEIGNIINLDLITTIAIDVKSISETIDSKFLTNTPNVGYFRIYTNNPVDIPTELFEHFSDFKSIIMAR
ncbi:MAG: hypothetical protein GPJ54_01610 [Candidatus Heimdallarchaeota archaeon]|nr:hypothetical protein [Candidatus Heimdallarchaeota archaeon]